MGVSSLPKTVTRQRRDSDLNTGLLPLSPGDQHANHSATVPPQLGVTLEKKSLALTTTTILPCGFQSWTVVKSQTLK